MLWNRYVYGIVLYYDDDDSDEVHLQRNYHHRLSSLAQDRLDGWTISIVLCHLDISKQMLPLTVII